MAKVKSILKELIPPIIFSVIRRLKKQNNSNEIWSGDYTTWAKAQRGCSGYNSNIILEKCKTALLKVKNGEAVYERDSVLFNEIHYSWGLLVGLQRAALENDGKLCVLDFGGSLGSSYFQNKEFLITLKKLQWCIVEQPNFVNCGRKHFESDQLKFYFTIEECCEKHKPNVLLLSGVLQYLEKPYEWIDKFVDLCIPYIIIDRTSFVESEKDILSVQNVPSSIYLASYPAWFFNETFFFNHFKNYSILGYYESYCDSKRILNLKHNAKWSGYLLKILN
jgi:putative methyltransferase (TIGR04325 family)